MCCGGCRCRGVCQRVVVELETCPRYGRTAKRVRVFHPETVRDLTFALLISQPDMTKTIVARILFDHLSRN